MDEWLITTAIGPHTKLDFNSLDLNLNVALMQPVPPLRPTHLLLMAPSARRFCAPPLRSSHSSTAVEIHSRTSPGKCWALVRWVYFWLGLQVSHCHIYKFNSCSSYALPYAHLGVVSKLFLVLFDLLSFAARSKFPDLPTMPRLR